MMDRNGLTVHLLGLEIDIKFLSVAEAASFDSDRLLLERAIHEQMRMAIEGERDIELLAQALHARIVDLQAAGPSSVELADRAQRLFIEKNS